MSEADVVAFGCRVRVRMARWERSLTIVGYDEADAAMDRVAFSAPLARALMGGAAGETIDFGGRPDAIEVLEVSWPAADHASISGDA